LEEVSGKVLAGRWCKNCGSRLKEEYSHCPRCGRMDSDLFPDNLERSRDYCVVAAGLVLLSAVFTIFFAYYSREREALSPS
jgi:uncharacterized paraquat-inducible protein A